MKKLLAVIVVTSVFLAAVGIVMIVTTVRSPAICEIDGLTGDIGCVSMGHAGARVHDGDCHDGATAFVRVGTAKGAAEEWVWAGPPCDDGWNSDSWWPPGPDGVLVWFQLCEQTDDTVTAEGIHCQPLARVKQ